MNNRREKAEEHYRQKFDALGLNFEFVRREWSQKHDKRIWVRCKRCGTELLRYNDLFKGRAKGIRCPICNGEQANAILEFYQEGHSVTETAKVFGITKSKVNDLVKRRGATNGRTFEQGGVESNLKRSQEALGHNKNSPSHIVRAKRLGLPTEQGITLKKLYARDKGVCQICGLICIYPGDSSGPLYPSIDHIIPLANDPQKRGGHTWKNVQLAHRLCNIRKSDLIGKEWNNASQEVDKNEGAC